MAKADTSATALTIREHEVTQLLLAGLGIKEIGLRLQISPNTVRNHVKRVYGKLEVHDRIALVLTAIATGLVRIPLYDSHRSQPAVQVDSGAAFPQVYEPTHGT